MLEEKPGVGVGSTSLFMDLFHKGFYIRESTGFYKGTWAGAGLEPMVWLRSWWVV